MDDPKVILLTPLYRSIPSSSVAALLQLISEVSKSGYLGGINMQVDLYISTARNKLAMAALDAWKAGEATHAFWVDDDMSVPPGALEQLLAHDKHVVSGLYYCRDLKPCVFDLEPFGKWEEAPKTGLQQVECTGFGCLLMRIKVLSDMMEMWGDTAWFQTPHNTKKDGGIAMTGEDVFFFERLKEMGIPAYLDCDVKPDHVGSMVFNEVLVNAVKSVEGITIGDHRR